MGTSSLETARIKRDELAEADEAYWAGMALAAAAQDGDGNAQRAMERRRYEAARAAAMACGFRYRPVEQLTGEQHLEDVVRRLVALNGRGGAIARQTMVPTRRSTTGSTGGANGAFGRMFSTSFQGLPV